LEGGKKRVKKPNPTIGDKGTYRRIRGGKESNRGEKRKNRNKKQITKEKEPARRETMAKQAT